jgi:hypothetical protein
LLVDVVRIHVLGSVIIVSGSAVDSSIFSKSRH